MSEEAIKELVKTKVIDLKKCGHIHDQWLETIVSSWSRFYQAAVRENPSGEVTLLVGCMQGLYLKDRSIIDRAIELTKDNVEEEDLLFLVGLALCNLGDRSDGLTYLRIQKDKYPTEGTLKSFLGALDSQGDEAEELESVCEEVLENNPNDIDALVRMASVWLYRDCPDQALPYIERAQAINPFEGDRVDKINGNFVRFYHGLYLYQKGNYTEALRYFKTCPKKAPVKPYFEYPAYWEQLFKCYHALGRFRRARNAVRRLEKCLMTRGIYEQEDRETIQGYYDDLKELRNKG